MNIKVFCDGWVLKDLAEKKELFKQFGFVDQAPCILLVDDDPAILESVGESLKSTGCDIVTAASVNDGMQLLQQHLSRTILIISDFKLNNETGFDFRTRLLSGNYPVPFVILSGFVDRDLALKGMEYKIAAFLAKPLDLNQLMGVLSKDGVDRMTALKEDRELLAGFVEDAQGLIEQVETLTLELEEQPNAPETIAKIFGMVHTIKGSSGFFEPKTLHSFAHRFEDVLKQIQGGTLRVTTEVTTVMLKSVDILKRFLAEFKSGQHGVHNLDEYYKLFEFNQSSDAANTADLPVDPAGLPTANAAKEVAAKQASSELKVSIHVLDEFMQISGEMTVVRNMINKVVRSIEKQNPGDKDVLRLVELLEELHKINSLVQSKITELRKVPMKNVLKPIPRAIRDVSKKLGKEIEFTALNEDLRIDTSIAEVLSQSLIHLVRNSLDHGIEGPDDRVAQGKKRTGTISIESRLEGDLIAIEIVDDGKGINVEAIKKKLLAQQMRTPSEIEKMSESQIFSMIFESGFSTAEKITDVSGRGVGMSMVKDVVESIGGRIQIQSLLGHGARFKLLLPVPKSVLIINSLFVSSGSEQFGIPQDNVLRVIKIDGDNYDTYINRLEGAQVLRLDGEVVHMLYLKKELMGCPPLLEERSANIVVIKTNSDIRFALVVDQIDDIEDAVVKGLTVKFQNAERYLGATFLGDGKIGLILNVDSLAQRAGLNQRILPVAEQKATAPAVVVRDGGSDVIIKELLLFQLNGSAMYAVPKAVVYRIEEFSRSDVQYAAGQPVIPYRGSILQLRNLSAELGIGRSKQPVDRHRRLQTFVVSHQNRFYGFVVENIVDVVEVSSAVEPLAHKVPGLTGQILITFAPQQQPKAVTVVDFLELLKESQFVKDVQDYFSCDTQSNDTEQLGHELADFTRQTLAS